MTQPNRLIIEVCVDSVESAIASAHLCIQLRARRGTFGIVSFSPADKQSASRQRSKFGCEPCLGVFPCHLSRTYVSHTHETPITHHLSSNMSFKFYQQRTHGFNNITENVYYNDQGKTVYTVHTPSSWSFNSTTTISKAVPVANTSFRRSSLPPPSADRIVSRIVNPSYFLQGLVIRCPFERKYI